MGFFEKFFELQYKMLDHNNKLNSQHPYQSRPHSWPLMLRGISYWSNYEKKEQIYMTGNIAGWWMGLLCIFVFGAIRVVDMGLIKRDIHLVNQSKYKKLLGQREILTYGIVATRNRFNRTGGFFLLLWITHYIPFFGMGRSLYLHHYLPAMACNYLLIGSVFEFLFIECVNSPISYQPNEKKYSVTRSRTTAKSYIAAMVILAMQYTVYLFLSPMTYGTPGLTSDEAYKRKIFDTWDVRYGKYYK